MQQPDHTTSGLLTYAIGAFFIWVSKLGLNDWVAILSIILLLIRLLQEGKQLLAKRKSPRDEP